MNHSNECMLVPCGKDGLPLGSDLPEIPEDLAAICRSSAEHYYSAGFVPPWAGYLLARDNTWLGGGAFVTAPENGRVEIAYFTLPAHEGQGFGRTTATLLVELARRADPAVTLWAKTLPEENASTAILRSLGFRHTGSTTDHEIGEAWEWLLEPGEPS